MKSTEPPSLATLRELLYAATNTPAATADALADERTRLAGDAPLAHELLAAELRWLAAQHDNGVSAGAEFAAARRSWLALRVRGLAAAPPDARVLCDLAEAQAAADEAGETAIAREAEQAIAVGAPRVAASQALDEEVRERFALLVSAIDDVPLSHQVRLLRASGLAVLAMAAPARSKVCRRLGNRMLRAADDRELACRLEARLGRRGVAWLETTNLVLLLVVLAVLLLESALALGEAQLRALHAVEAAACVFFVADYLFELALHPSRLSWFVRSALTDLVPAVPAVLFLLPGVDVAFGGSGIALVRGVRIVRVTWIARYVQALRPLVRALRLLLFLVRGLDGLVARFQHLLNREFVFVPGAAEVGRAVRDDDRRDLLFASLRREHELCALLPATERAPVLRARAERVRATTAAMLADGVVQRVAGATSRDIPLGEAIEFLWAMRPQDVGRWLRPADVQALDRVVRVVSSPPVRWLPLIARVAVHPLPATPEERIVAASRRIAAWLDAWHGRMLFFADLHGIVTGPQILDRVATALIKATHRPTLRLLVIGSLFSLFGSHFSTPLFLLGGICLVLLLLGHWLKRLAGQASEAYRLTSEAHFLSQLERIKPRYEDEDLAFLAARVFGDGECAVMARRMLKAQVASARTGVPIADAAVPEWVRLEANRAALLYLHFLDGAPLHAGDVKTTEQLLANQSLENLRTQFLCIDKKERKRLRRLKLDDGSIFAGPFLWFRFITESIAVEAAKRIAGYNRWCIPLAERAAATPEALASMNAWLQRRRDPRGGRAIAEKARGAATAYPTAEFTALDFVGGDPERDHHIATLFGDEVLAVVRADRRTMVREIFGTRPVHQLPKHERSFNVLRFYRDRFSHGRVLLAPVLLGWRFARRVGWLFVRVRQVVREVFDPELAMQRHEIGEAPFAVALRKIHRMKAPGLREAIRMRLQLDAEYAGAPAGWSARVGFVAPAPFERDVQFLHMHEQESVRLRDAASQVRAQVRALYAALAGLPRLGDAHDDDARAASELAVTCAWITDQERVRTLLGAPAWFTDALPRLARAGLAPPWRRRAFAFVRRWVAPDAVDRWVQRHAAGLDARAVRAVRAAYARNVERARDVVDAWLALPAGASPAESAIATLQRAWRNGEAVRRDLMALRAVQSLAVLDVRNYRDLVFQLGDYGADGEDEALGRTLP
jgi:hypothetical protein